ncbi:MAG: CTP synthase [Candidatus Lokiarchaeota archaeon]|nr:CTP synthase [Candidatus Lokiarchaeota archaeon]
MTTKYIFVTGGVMSGIGKGVTTASIAKLLQFRDFNVSIMKIDPYLNIDPGTLNPVEHGECFITEEVWTFDPLHGDQHKIMQPVKIAELDQDFGTYERFLGQFINPSHNITSGQIYFSVIYKERAGKFLGKTVQLIPHCTDEVIHRMVDTATNENLDVLLIECGGTVGDLESTMFLEAFRQFRLQLPKKDTLLVHVTLVPYLKTVGQLKSKPTQHSVRALQSMGLQPDVMVCRSEIPLTSSVRQKISLFSNVPENAVISSPDLPTIYRLPLKFEEQKLGDYICDLLDVKPKLVKYDPIRNYSEWKKMVELYTSAKDSITIAMPGKYIEIPDSYVSINEALTHACAHERVKLNINWVDTEKEAKVELKGCDGILLTPGFGSRGVEGMIECAEYALEHKIPYLGICFGAQLFYIAFCRKILGLKGAHTTEIDPNTPYPVVDFLEGQKSLMETGGTMRLGAYDIYVDPSTKLFQAYKKEIIRERFRHRFHIMEKFLNDNPKSKELKISGRDETGKIVNAIELVDEDHWMIGTQFHAEFKSRPYAPSPLYHAFIKAVKKNRSIQ